MTPLKKIIHCDADCFFAAIEMRDDPSLANVPMAVGGRPGSRGVISTCNYEARRYGIHSAMASGQAMKLCPNLILLPHNMDKYKLASQQLKQIFLDYSDCVEMFSIDEAYLDVTDSQLCQGSATLIAREIRQRVKEEIGITLSAGVATNKFLAKIASEWRKPDGLYTIRPGQELGFIASLPVKYIQGVGKVTQSKMERLGLYTCGDIRHTPTATLIEHFGSFAPRLKQLSEGIDDRPVKPNRIRKSLSVEHTFSQDLPTLRACLDEAGWTFEKLEARLAQLTKPYRISKLQVKVKFDDFSQTTMETGARALNLDIYKLLISQAVSRHKRPVRLLGMGVQLGPNQCETMAEQLELFSTAELSATPMVSSAFK